MTFSPAISKRAALRTLRPGAEELDSATWWRKAGAEGTRAEEGLSRDARWTLGLPRGQGDPLSSPGQVGKRYKTLSPAALGLNLDPEDAEWGAKPSVLCLSSGALSGCRQAGLQGGSSNPSPIWMPATWAALGTCSPRPSPTSLRVAAPPLPTHSDPADQWPHPPPKGQPPLNAWHHQIGPLLPTELVPAQETC